MRLFILLFIILSPYLYASDSFKIPRSEVVEITDSESKRTYPLFIKLPTGYHKKPLKKYPVIYLTDAWYTFQIVSGATRYPMNSNMMKQVIIVGISYEKGSKGDRSRVRDYTPTVSQHWRKKTGGAHQHMEFIERDVFSYISNNYRVLPNENTFIGNSLGGLFGAYIMMKKPQMFKNYILGSPSFWFDNQVIYTLEKEFLMQKKTVEANVFIGIGERESKAFDSNYEMVKDAEKFHRKMGLWQQSKLKNKLYIIPQANHQMAFPTTAIHGLHWVLKN